MKKTTAILTALIVMLSLRADAFDDLNLNGYTLRERLVSFEVLRQPLDRDLEKLGKKIDLITAKNGADFSGMSEASLKELVNFQKQYAIGKQQIVDGLGKVYITGYKSSGKTIQQKLKFATDVVMKNCRIIDRMAKRCLNQGEALIFQVHYLNLQIQELNTLEDSLLSQINTTINQDEGSIYL